MYEKCIYLESPIVNRFKKTMTLYHASVFHKGDEHLEPSFISVGNKIEPETGPSTFFFSKFDYAMNYLLGSAATKLYGKYVSQYIELAKKNGTESEIAELSQHIANMSRNGLFKLPPLCNALSYDARVYHLDDRAVCSLPICYNFKAFLESLDKFPVYIYECEVETSKIKHGHSKDFQEFSVFERVPVKKVHKMTIAELTRKVKIKTIPYVNIGEFMKKLNSRKDPIRSVITHDDWIERKRNYNG